MPYHLFQYPLPAPADLGDLNAFLETHRVVSVQEHMLPTAGGGLLVFVVQSVAQSSPAGPSSSGKRIDYKAVLDPEQFALFSLLREERKKMAQADGVPIYTILTNEQLAEMVRGPVRTLPEMAKIEGIGAARLEKYGSRLLEILTTHLPPLSPTVS